MYLIMVLHVGQSMDHGSNDFLFLVQVLACVESVEVKEPTKNLNL